MGAVVPKDMDVAVPQTPPQVVGRTDIYDVMGQLFGQPVLHGRSLRPDAIDSHRRRSLDPPPQCVRIKKTAGIQRAVGKPIDPGCFWNLVQLSPMKRSQFDQLLCSFEP